MTSERKPLPGRTERLMRALLLLAASVCFSLIAWATGAFQIQNQTLAFGIAGAVVVAAILMSRFCAKLIMRRFFR